MSNLDVAILVLDGLIAGVESGSEIPVMASELKMIKLLIEKSKMKGGA